MKKKNEQPQVDKQTLGDFFNASRTYAVPDYQRKYDWSEDHVEQTLTDLYEFSESPDSMYLLGQVIICDSDKPGYTYELIDGQQRSSTLMVLFAAISKAYDRLEQKHSEIYTAYRKDHPRSPESIIRVLMSGKASDTLMSYAENKEMSKETPSQANIAKAIESVEEYLKSKNLDSDVELLDDFTHNLLNHVWVITLYIPDREKAYEYFELTNTRGLKLNSSDNLKNRILSLIKSTDESEKAARIWEEAETDLFTTKDSKEGTMQSLLSHLYKAKFGESVKHNELYKAWKSRLINDKNCQELIELIDNKVDKLVDIINNSGSNGSKHMNFVQNYSVLLAGSHLSTSSYELLEKRVEAAAMLWLLASKGTNSYDTMVIKNKWALKVSELPVNATIDEIKDATFIGSKSKDGSTDSNGNPIIINGFSDLQKLADRRIDELRYDKNDDSKRLRYILAKVNYELNSLRPKHYYKVSDYLVAHKKTAKKETPGFHLDHIGAQGDEKWKRILGDKLHSLGNLALLYSEDNEIAGTDSPAGKSARYQGSVCYATNALSSIPQTHPDVEAVIAKYRVAADGTGDDEWGPSKVDELATMYKTVLFNGLKKDLGE